MIESYNPNYQLPNRFYPDISKPLIASEGTFSHPQSDAVDSLIAYGANAQQLCERITRDIQDKHRPTVLLTVGNLNTTSYGFNIDELDQNRNVTEEARQNSSVIYDGTDVTSQQILELMVASIMQPLNRLNVTIKNMQGTLIVTDNVACPYDYCMMRSPHTEQFQQFLYQCYEICNATIEAFNTANGIDTIHISDYSRFKPSRDGDTPIVSECYENDYVTPQKGLKDTMTELCIESLTTQSYRLSPPRPTLVLTIPHHILKRKIDQRDPTDDTESLRSLQQDTITSTSNQQR